MALDTSAHIHHKGSSQRHTDSRLSCSIKRPATLKVYTSYSVNPPSHQLTWKFRRLIRPDLVLLAQSTSTCPRSIKTSTFTSTCYFAPVWLCLFLLVSPAALLIYCLLSKTPCGAVLTAIGGCHGSEAIVQGLSAGRPLTVPLGAAWTLWAAAHLNSRGASVMEYMQVAAVVAQHAQAHHVSCQQT